jgi:hypothetical protein
VIKTLDRQLIADDGRAFFCNHADRHVDIRSRDGNHRTALAAPCSAASAVAKSGLPNLANTRPFQWRRPSPGGADISDIDECFNTDPCRSAGKSQRPSTIHLLIS